MPKSKVNEQALAENTQLQSADIDVIESSDEALQSPESDCAISVIVDPMRPLQILSSPFGPSANGWGPLFHENVLQQREQECKLSLTCRSAVGVAVVHTDLGAW